MRPLAMWVLLSLAVDLQRFVAPTNSHAASVRGTEAFAKGDYRSAERAFREAARMNPGPVTAFDLGTAQIAAGNTGEGAALLDDAVKDPSLAPDAFYNRGSSALRSKAFDEAIRDFENSLRLRPGDPAAKRNLEIALRRRQEQQQQQQSEQQQNQSGGQQPDQPRQAPGDDGGQEERSDAESLLRSVEQQEREELSRMRRSKRAQPRIGW